MPPDAFNAPIGLKRRLIAEKEAALLQTLVKRRPELTAKSATHQAMAGRFVAQQQRLMNQGYTEEKAYALTGAKFAAVFAREQRSATLLQDIASSARARSYMDHYQQLAVSVT